MSLWQTPGDRGGVVKNLARRFWRHAPTFVAPLFTLFRGLVSVVLVGGIVAVGVDYFTKDPTANDSRAESIIKEDWPCLVLGSLIVVALLGLSWVGHRRDETDYRLRNVLGFVKRTKALSLADFGFRAAEPGDHARQVLGGLLPFFGTYLPRRAIDVSGESIENPQSPQEYSEEDLERLLRAGRGLLLLDAPHAGKTLTAYYLLRRLKGYVVIRPGQPTPAVSSDDLRRLLRGELAVMFLDDLPDYHRDYDIASLIQQVTAASGSPCAVIATARHGGGFNAITVDSTSRLNRFCQTLLHLQLAPLSRKETVNLAETAGVEIKREDTTRYVYPGDITLANTIREMQQRFLNLDTDTREAIRVMKFLDEAGVRVSRSRIEAAWAVALPDVPKPELVGTLDHLWEQFFLRERPSGETVVPNPLYLASAVTDVGESKPDEHEGDELADALEGIADVDGLLQLAEGHRQRGDLIRAIRALDAALRIDDDSADAHFRRGYALARLDSPEDALAANDRAIALRQDFPEALNNRAYILSRLNKLDEALEAVDQALAYRSQFDDAHTNRGIILARLGRFPDAMEEFKKALGLRSESYYAYLNMGITLSRQDLFGEALSAFAQARTIRPNYPEAYLNEGITRARWGDLEGALDSHDQALRLRDDYADAHLYRGQTLARIERYDDAIKAFDRAIELRPAFAEAYASRARTRGHMGPTHREAALADWQQAVEAGLALPDTSLSYGVSLVRAGEVTKALQVFDSIIERYPNPAGVYFWRGRAFAAEGDWPKAQLEFERAIECRSDYAQAHCDLGSALANQGHLDEALASIDNALALRPKFAEAYRERGYVLSLGFDRERLSKALDAFGEAVRIRPDYLEAHYGRGFVLGRLGWDPEALAAWDRVLELRPEHAGALFSKARTLCFLAHKQPERFPPSPTYLDAMDLLERAVKLDSGVVSRVERDRSAFLRLRDDPGQASRFRALFGTR